MFAISELMISQKVLSAGRNVCAYLPHNSTPLLSLTAVAVSKNLDQQHRFYAKHYNPKWKRFRALKVLICCI